MKLFFSTVILGFLLVLLIFLLWFFYERAALAFSPPHYAVFYSADAGQTWHQYGVPAVIIKAALKVAVEENRALFVKAEITRSGEKTERHILTCTADTERDLFLLGPAAQ